MCMTRTDVQNQLLCLHDVRVCLCAFLASLLNTACARAFWRAGSVCFSCLAGTYKTGIGCTACDNSTKDCAACVAGIQHVHVHWISPRLTSLLDFFMHKAPYWSVHNYE